IGLMGLIVVKVLVPGFYSRQDIKTPVKIALVTLALTQVMNLIFIGPLQHAGLALSIGLASCLNAGLLYWQLRKQQLFQPRPGWGSFLVKLVIAVLAMSAVLIALLVWMPAWDIGGMTVRISRLMLVVVAGAGTYFAMLALLGFRPRDFARRGL
ncbi:lipid II flippase MurJ, partial [Candidatus Symbiopectobacterium sp. NZEC135]